MAAPKLNADQRAQLLVWLAAAYDAATIAHWFQERQWPAITRQTIDGYRKRYGIRIAELRVDRHAQALTTGLALREERIRRLMETADRLDTIKWEADENGRLWNVKAWRETLDDIAKELGHRRQGVDVTLEQELKDFLDLLQHNLDTETYARILALAARAGTTRGE